MASGEEHYSPFVFSVGINLPGLWDLEGLFLTCFSPTSYSPLATSYSGFSRILGDIPFTSFPDIAFMINGSVYRGDFYEVKDWLLNDTGNSTLAKGYNDCFCFVLVQRGHFLFDLFHQPYELHSGRLVIDKPDYEYQLHATTCQCSVFNFTNELYASIVDEYNLNKSSFFSNKNIIARTLSCTPVMDYLHHRVLQQLASGATLEMDTLIMELLKQVVEGATSKQLDRSRVSREGTPVNKHHLNAIEAAREYMQSHFLHDISLLELSRHCYISPFYLSRLFKHFTGLPPYKYLQEIRLKHAEMLVKHSHLPIADICYASGFNNTDYFTAAFTKKFKKSPTRWRVSN